MAAVTSPRPLAATDDREGFDCGRESVNLWFRYRAWENQVSGVTRTNVIADRSTGALLGFVGLSAGQIERGLLAKPHRRNKPEAVPVILLGQLAVDRHHHGEGHGRSLLLFALETAVAASRQVGSFGVITHPIDETVRAFYGRWGFEPLPFDPRGAMIVRTIDLVASGIGS